jgi:hypothetical protein
MGQIGSEREGIHMLIPEETGMKFIKDGNSRGEKVDFWANNSPDEISSNHTTPITRSTYCAAFSDSLR